MSLHGLDILSMWMLFFSLLCVTASAFQHSHLAKDVEVFVTNCMNNPRSCSAGVDEMRVLQLFVFFVPTMFSGILGFFGKNSIVLSLFGLHANTVEEYVLSSALLHDQSCLQSSLCFQHQFVWLPFSRTLVCKGRCSFHVHGSTRVVPSSLCYVAVSRARENNSDKPLLDVIIIDCLCHCH